MDTAPQEPAHPVAALTTFELRDYRGQLEGALSKLPEHAEVRSLIRQKLDAVLAEQDARARLSAASVR
jgi:hypothetical protein